MRPPIRLGYFGNAILDEKVMSYSGKLMSKPLGCAASRIRAAIEKVTDRYVRLTMEFLRHQPDLTRFQKPHALRGNEGPFYGNPNLAVISWMALQMNMLDFGWGREVYVGQGSHDFDGGLVVLSGPEGDGSVVVSLCLQVQHV